MTKNILTIVILTAFIFTSCMDNPKQENKEIVSKETVEKTADEIITGKETDKNGKVLEYSFNNTKSTATFKLNGETIEMVVDTMASGAHYKNDHYNYHEWHGKTTIEKDGKIIFEAGTETMPK
jgi:membrane-bound inhibitor of C-type lysozyme